MNQNPEARLLTRYAVMLALGALAFVIGPRAFGHGVFGYVLLAAAVMVTRIVFATPLRFAERNATPQLRAVWYVFLAEVIAAAVAFVLAFDRSGSIAGSIVAVAVVILFEVVATRMQHAEHVRTGAVIEAIPGESVDLAPITGDALGPENQALKNALADLFAEIPTVVRAYLVLSAPDDATDRRILALRFAYPWIDEDAFRAALRVFGHIAPGGGLTMISLDDKSEARARRVASPFYERPT